MNRHREMPKVLCVAEKPSISKALAGLLANNRFQTRNTRDKYIKNYDFDSTFEGQPCRVTMTCLIGHLMGLDFPDDVRRWQSVDPAQLFELPVRKFVPKDKRELQNNIKQESRNAMAVVIWTDCDLEGENIGGEVVEVCRQANPRILVKRARFSVVQQREVLRAWTNLQEMDWNQVSAVDTRQELDLRIGAAFTRFQTLYLQNKFPQQLEDNIVSYGSCQFPTLGFIVDQFELVKSFCPEDFWKINLQIKKGNEVQNFSWCRNRLFDHQTAVAIFEDCVNNPTATVVELRSKPTEKWRPLPLTTVEMMKFASNVLRITSDRVMKLAEDLYTQGFISYPRTETDVFDRGFNLHELIHAQTQDPRWSAYATGLENGGFVFPRGGGHNDQAHPPIHPTKCGAGLDGDNARLYEFITRRFLACCSANARGHETSVDLVIAGERFTASGLVIQQRNYLEIYTYDKWNASTLIPFQRNETVQPHSLQLVSGKTTGPQLLSEAELISAMEKGGIGTDATIAEHIKKILERQYAEKENGKFSPTTLGMGLIAGYRDMELGLSLAKPYLRSQMEASIKAICSGVKTKEECITESVNMYRGAFQEANDKANKLAEALARLFG
ncbi:DNA topoisomerase 3-alpha [Irineochytrium annulatum]|nr:DNA topoisomerase 3-alpha [Irineochytrium annulatum]